MAPNLAHPGEERGESQLQAELVYFWRYHVRISSEAVRLWFSGQTLNSHSTRRKSELLSHPPCLSLVTTVSEGVFSLKISNGYRYFFRLPKKRGSIPQIETPKGFARRTRMAPTSSYVLSKKFLSVFCRVYLRQQYCINGSASILRISSCNTRTSP